VTQQSKETDHRERQRKAREAAREQGEEAWLVNSRVDDRLHGCQLCDGNLTIGTPNGALRGGGQIDMRSSAHGKRGGIPAVDDSGEIVGELRNGTIDD